MNPGSRDAPGPETLAAVLDVVADRQPGGIVAYDRDGYVRYVDETYAEMLNVDAQTLLGEHVAVTNPEFDRSRFPAYWDSFAAGETRRAETVHEPLGCGPPVPVVVETTQTSVDGADYHVATVSAVFRQQTSVDENGVFREAVEQAGHTVVITDIEGTIQYVNPAFEDETGYSREEALGRTPAILNSGKHSDEFYQRLWETIESGELWESEVLNRRKSGELYHVDQTIAPITDEAGTITHYVAVEYDVTDRKLQKKRLSELNRVLRHNLRNSVLVLEGHAEYLYGDIENEEARVLLSRILDRTESLKSTISRAAQLRSFLERDDTRQPSCNVETELLDIVAELRERHPDTTITVETTPLVAGIEPMVYRAIVEDIVDNAVYHNDQSTPAVDVSVEVETETHELVVVRVADNGPGIETSEQTAITADPERPLQHGTGLGLSHVHWLATEFGGDIDISENEPRGTVVTLSIPLDGDHDLS